MTGGGEVAALRDGAYEGRSLFVGVWSDWRWGMVDWQCFVGFSVV